MMNSRIHRRRFLRDSLAGATGFLILDCAQSVWSAQANERLNVALVGVGGRGEWFVETLPKMENLVALCDVNARTIEAAFQRWEDLAKRFATSPNDWERRAAQSYQAQLDKKPKTFGDFRRLLDESGRSLDAVFVATPDHTHAVIAAAAIRAGKPVFCEKPLTRTVHEARALRELARKHKVPTAMGNQGTYSGPFRRALELIRNGTLGEIKEVHVWNNGGGADKKERPQGEPPVPEYLQWDLWLGPAAFRPYHPDWLNRNAWRDFGTCQLGNWAPHSANLGFMSLKVQDLWLADPPPDPHPILRVQARTSGLNRLSFPRWECIEWEVPARAGLAPITIKWYNGVTPAMQEVLDRAAKDAPEKQKDQWRFAGTLIVGTKGSIHTTGHNMWFRLLPADQFRGVQCDRPETVDASPGAEQDFFAACRGRKTPWSNFDYADALIEFLMLGNVATQAEGKLDFDPVSMRIVNNHEADGLLRCEYRQGWNL
jgi:hypothetical protein